ncbi:MULTISPECIES: FkbM family methyltransferase [Niastella]|uniref:FkbM family methyltransferase n=1 Tax=Niastella soli TaxID=2821487 RepID=A0ABS3YLS9_9BACT|nr:FkbM family methyltransferase [Niastella soli]MBO9198831.1 FkbM family methyltransferase [Niastella soli]
MTSQFKKKVVTTLRYVYKVGIIKSLLIGLAMSASGEEYEVKWKGRHYHIRKHSSDFKVFRAIAVFGQYNVPIITGSNNVKTIIDLGSNIGFSVMHFKSKFPDAQVIAVEPEKHNFEQLVKNVKGYSKVVCLQNAIWYSEKKLGIFDSGLGEYGFRVVDGNQKQVGSVDAITMDDIISKYGLQTIDILKIDIEGAEKELFTYNYENWLPKVRCIVIELHDTFHPGCATAFFKAISTRQFDIFCKGEDIIITFTDTKQDAVQYA